MKPFTRIARLAAGLGLAGLLAIGSAVPAFAAGESGVTVTGGSLSGGSLTFSDITAVTLDGTQKTSTGSWSIANVADARGTGAGWNVSLALTQLKEYSGTAYVVGGKALPTSSLKVTTAPVVSLVDSTSSPANTVTPVATTTALDTGSAVKLLTAAVDGGMGSYAASALGVTLTLRADTFAKTYKTDATVSLNTGP